MKKLIGPFSQIVTMRRMPLKGSLKDEKLEIVKDGGIVVKDGCIKAVGDMNSLSRLHHGATLENIDRPAVLLPGFIDCHTHLCFSGTRSSDYAMRISGKSYLEIAKSGGGIWNTVESVRNTSEAELMGLLLQRIKQHVAAGITTIEVKSGYGLNIDCELRLLRAIKMAGVASEADIISTCLAAHIKPKDFKGEDKNYLQHIIKELLPVIKEKELCRRVDIFIEETAFCQHEASKFLMAAGLLGFNSTVHADQFTPGSSLVAIAAGAHSADHLEASTDIEINALADSNTVAVVLPGASFGLGLPYAPARKILNAGACLAIASDWNPGSAPHGDLLMQAAIMGAAEKLNTAETFAALTYRAAHALRLNDRGIIDKGNEAQMQAYPTADYRDILYYQGTMKPFKVWTKEMPMSEV
ncbi:MAG: imidazolonepropionase [Bacteroidota bacterium]